MAVTLKYHIYRRGGVWFVRRRRKKADGAWVWYRGVIGARNTLDAAHELVRWHVGECERWEGAR